MVRITEIDLNDDGTLTFSAEEYLAGTASAATYSFQTGNGYNPDFNVDPGDANAPVIADVPVQIAPTGLETWIAASGSDSGWGGCDVWNSADGDNYKSQGTINGSCRQGVLRLLWPQSDPDTVHTLSVDLRKAMASYCPVRRMMPIRATPYASSAVNLFRTKPRR